MQRRIEASCNEGFRCPWFRLEGFYFQHGRKVLRILEASEDQSIAAQPLGTHSHCPGSGGEGAEQNRVDGHMFLWVQGSGSQQLIELQAALQDQGRSFRGPCSCSLLQLVAVSAEPNRKVESARCRVLGLEPICEAGRDRRI